LHNDVKIKSADVIRPVLELSHYPGARLVQNVFLPEQLQRLRLLQGSVMVAGRPLAQKIEFIIRRIGEERDLSWEIQARLAGGDVISQGRVRNTGQVTGIFSAS